MNRAYPQTILAVVMLCMAGQRAYPQTADEIIDQYMQAVQKEIGENPRALGQDGVLRKFEELGKKHLLKNKEILHRKAAEQYVKLDELKLSGVLAQIKQTPRAEQRGREIVISPNDDKLKQMVQMFSEGGYGVPPFGRHVLATRWWDPEVAARTIRELTFRHMLDKDESEKRKFLEQYAPPRIYRANGDAETPVIVFYDGQEVFVVELKYIQEGIYVATSLAWSKPKS